MQLTTENWAAAHPPKISLAKAARAALTTPSFPVLSNAAVALKSVTENALGAKEPIFSKSAKT